MEDSRLEKWRQLVEKGNHKLGQADYQSAERYFRKGLKLANEIAVPVVKAFSLRLLATSQIKQGLTETAAHRFREALQICQEIDNAKGMAEAMAGLANVFIQLGDPEEAVIWFKRAIAVYPAEASQLRLAMLYNDLGRVYAALENWQEAQATYEQAMEICQSYGYLKGLAELAVLTAEACFRLGEKEKARRLLFRSCRIFIQNGERDSLITALLFLGSLAFEQERHEEAREAMHRALILQLHNPLVEEVSENCFFLAKTLQELDLLDEAYYYMNLSLKFYKKRDVSFVLRLKSMAELLLRKKELSKAKGFVKEALAILRHLGEQQLIQECLFLRESIKLLQGSTDQAEHYSQSSARKLEGQNAVSFSAVHRLANYYEERQNYVDAIQCYWQSMQIAREFGYDTKELEKSVQRVSRKVRKKRR